MNALMDIQDILIRSKKQPYLTIEINKKGFAIAHIRKQNGMPMCSAFADGSESVSENFEAALEILKIEYKKVQK